MNTQRITEGISRVFAKEVELILSDTTIDPDERFLSLVELNFISLKVVNEFNDMVVAIKEMSDAVKDIANETVSRNDAEKFFKETLNEESVQ